MIAFFIAMCIALCFVNLRPEVQLQPGSKERAVVLEVDNSGIMQQGILMAGGQKLKIKILSGEYTGETFDHIISSAVRWSSISCFSPATRS